MDTLWMGLQKHWLELFSFLVGIIGTIWGFLNKNRDTIQAIVLRIEKESQDGWTPGEKEQLAVDLFFKEIWDKLPAQYWLLKLIPKIFIENFIRQTIKDICNKSHQLKDKIEPKVTEPAKATIKV